MAATMRLPPGLKADADAYAAKLGISVNALVAVALRDYIDGRTMRPSAAPSTPRPAPARPAPLPPRPALPLPPPIDARSYPAPRSRSDPCPCGALSPDGHRLKWKQCHGRTSPA